jgi:iron(III) transport system ATP-binding protein
MAVAVVDNLRFSYADGHVALDGVSLEIADGEFIVILGPSGCGKTTTLRLIAGLETPDRGSIAIDGRLMSAPAEGIFVRPEERGIGMVFQSYAVWPHMSVFENVAYPLRVRGLSRAAIRGKVHDVLELVGLAAEARRAATELSGGQMQRVALARALVYDPALLLFDEPLSNLDLKLRERLRVELKTLQRRTGLTSIYVTHDQSEAVELGDRIMVMEGGRVVQVGASAELYRRPNTRFVAEFIASANILEGAVLGLLGPSTARVKADQGPELTASFDSPVAIGERVAVVIHPEDCVIAPPGAERGGAHSVLIRQRRFQGLSTRYTVEWSGASFDVVALGTATELEEGSRALLSIPEERARIIAP